MQIKLLYNSTKFVFKAIKNYKATKNKSAKAVYMQNKQVITSYIKLF
jgi:hypothetical protein